ncbi:MAG: hypothetical protein ACREIC_24005, partial [Limisphaerales bacterium]
MTSAQSNEFGTWIEAGGVRAKDRYDSLLARMSVPPLCAPGEASPRYRPALDFQVGTVGQKYEVCRFEADIPFSKRRTPIERALSLSAEFRSLSRKWREQVGAESSLSRITGNLNYLRVIALGKRVVPLILEDLKREPAPWFTALRALTGETEIGKEHAGNFRRIAEAWIE